MQHISIIKREARHVLSKKPHNLVNLGLIPTIVLVILFILLFRLSTQIVLQLNLTQIDKQFYADVQSFLTNNPQISLYYLEGFLAYGMFAVSVSFAALDQLRETTKQMGIAQSLQVFSGVYFFKVLVLWLVIYLIYYLGNLILLPIGLYFYYGFKLTYFILKDLTQGSARISWRNALKTLGYSWTMMRGHKWQLFVLDLSFIGWDLLNFMTLGLFNLYVAPYRAASYAVFYQNLLDQQIGARLS
ncbi:DUF975 family protein [Bombilactobacillus thymidiniphilus]|uniref:DUF975 family protein n=1 Tax=Bombilactobacillus thymidiniphilus TaxID=2923363 RepID=A0ABY4PD20_9LACO|nr:DUF975 family protein [Bombilactobacillus thymidiniphilus]UQS83172.1 DUF975 family protein [Bombilactobacillus thymidiniphilus]